MALSWTGIIVNVIMLIIITVALVFAFAYGAAVGQCENKESPYCYSVQCPCDIDPVSGLPSAPCFGYAKKPGPQPNTWYCSGSASTLVDTNGNILSTA